MELQTYVTAATAAKTEKKVAASELLATGGRVKIELGPDKELDVACPVGKAWLVSVTVHIVETDV